MQSILIAAQSLDGFITRHDEPGSRFTSEADKVYFQQVIHGFDCRVMGSVSYGHVREGTRRSAQRGRHHTILTRNPSRYAEEQIAGLLEFRTLSPSELLAEFRDRGYQRCAVLGGTQIYSLFLAERVIDELWLTIEPRLFGSGAKLLDGCHDISLRLKASESLSPDTLLLKYSIK